MAGKFLSVSIMVAEAGRLVSRLIDLALVRITNG
jgi:hypothetical protein